MKTQFALSIMLSLLTTNLAARETPKATETNVVYGKYERSKLDFWKAKSKKPTPVLVFFHGGGFKAGDKDQIKYFIPVKNYLKKDISCISVNYPFLQHTNNSFPAIMKECEKVIKLISKNAKKWNIDKKRIALSGCSAGALISEWVGTSTKGISALAIFWQPKGTEYLILKKIKSSCPPMIIFQESPATDAVHHPKFGKMLKKACDKKKVECLLYSSGKNDIPKPPGNKHHKEVVLEFLMKKWKMK